MKKIIVIVCLLSIASLTFASSLPEFPFVSSNGYAEVELLPNMAKVSFGFKAFNENPKNAVDTIIQRSKELLEFCAKQKIKREDMVAYEINKNIVRERKNYQELNILGYEVTRQFTITLHGLQIYEPLAKKLLSIENVENFHTKFDRTDREKIESDLLTKAAADAKRQAQYLAKGFDAQIDSVFAISEHEFRDIGTLFERAYVQASTGAIVDISSPSGKKGLVFVPSTINFNSRVSAIFKLKMQD